MPKTYSNRKLVVFDSREDARFYFQHWLGYRSQDLSPNFKPNT